MVERSEGAGTSPMSSETKMNVKKKKSWNLNSSLIFLFRKV